MCMISLNIHYLLGKHSVYVSWNFRVKQVREHSYLTKEETPEDHENIRPHIPVERQKETRPALFVCLRVLFSCLPMCAYIKIYTYMYMICYLEILYICISI